MAKGMPSPADLSRGQQTVRRPLETRAGCLGTADEELDCAVARELVSWDPRWVRWEEQWRDLPDELACDVERLLAAGHEAERWAGSEQAIGDARAHIDQMLAVVENDEHVGRARKVDHAVRHRGAGRRLQLESSGEGLPHQLGLVKGG
jgi:hypothetical protein